ncbi:uncharacterized protein LOC119674488 [Teleopsis dalmanni]|uniref:uncharacterized protein LOC119674488 n=1 Tax=Teleopsis dalmanni TaxID=139649 RepID=UPI0018CF842A|nr:uncharacterized protein LOC119674488 [Teleopsis dalmanni]
MLKSIGFNAFILLYLLTLSYYKCAAHQSEDYDYEDEDELNYPGVYSPDDECNDDDNNGDGGNNGNGENNGNGTNLYSLCRQFRDIRDLVPMSTLIAITSKHYALDARFQHAMEFRDTNRFKILTEQIEDSEPYQNMLAEFENVGVDTIDISTIPRIFNCLILSKDQISSMQWSARSIMPFSTNNASDILIQPRSLQTYTTDIMKLMSHREVRQLIESKLAKHPQFASFYRIMRNPAFRRKINRGFVSNQFHFFYNNKL